MTRGWITWASSACARCEQGCLQVTAVAEAGHLLGDGVGDLGHGVSHDLAEQALLVGELLVDGLLRQRAAAAAIWSMLVAW